jgi:hypothetical protein
MHNMPGTQPLAGGAVRQRRRPISPRNSPHHVLVHPLYSLRDTRGNHRDAPGPAEQAVEVQPPEEKPAPVVGKPAAKPRPIKFETPEEKRRRQTTNIILWGTQGTVSLVILLGAVQMIRLRTRWLAMTGSILAVIPVIGPCFCLALPFGIWAIIVLLLPDVREAFA